MSPKDPTVSLIFSMVRPSPQPKRFASHGGQGRADVLGYIEQFYNPTRRHPTLGYASSIDFEKASEADVGVLGIGSGPVHRAQKCAPPVKRSSHDRSRPA